MVGAGARIRRTYFECSLNTYIGEGEGDLQLLKGMLVELTQATSPFKPAYRCMVDQLATSGKLGFLQFVKVKRGTQFCYSSKRAGVPRVGRNDGISSPSPSSHPRPNRGIRYVNSEFE